MFDPDLEFPYIVSHFKPLCKAATTCFTKQHYKATMVAVGRQLTFAHRDIRAKNFPFLYKDDHAAIFSKWPFLYSGTTILKQ